MFRFYELGFDAIELGVFGVYFICSRGKLSKRLGPLFLSKMNIIPVRRMFDCHITK